jgi:hypothetical protein
MAIYPASTPFAGELHMNLMGCLGTDAEFVFE